MLDCFVSDKKTKSIPITIVAQHAYADWLNHQTESVKNWLRDTQFRPEISNSDVRLIPNSNGEVSRVVACVANVKDMWCIGNLSMGLPEGIYEFEHQEHLHTLAWGLSSYQFDRYKKPLRVPAKLNLKKTSHEAVASIEHIVNAIYLTRDLINTPTDDMGPSELSAIVKAMATRHHAKFHEIVGEALLQKNYPAIYTVGRASDDPPRLLDMRWGKAQHPKITLVGKGVCFDSGGLDIKSAPYMALMKKDMGGAAHVLGLADMIMNAKLPVALRVLIPCVENVIAGNAYRPGDIIKSRNGLTIEIGNTDAEGRVILADALTEAVSEKPVLLIDLATLTGAARIALGPDLPVMFSNQDELARKIITAGDRVQDYMWQLPLFKPYREYLNSQIADINNNSNEPYAGAITAALFLQEFVPNDIPWLHFDIMAWNIRPRLGRSPGGEAMVIRALFEYIQHGLLRST